MFSLQPDSTGLDRRRSAYIGWEIAMVPCSMGFVRVQYSMLRTLYILILASPDYKVRAGWCIAV
jgi:hypothetical protein